MRNKFTKQAQTALTLAKAAAIDFELGYIGTEHLLLGLASLLSYFQQNAWLGFLQGVIITSLAVLVTMFFTKIKWFWRT